MELDAWTIDEDHDDVCNGFVVGRFKRFGRLLFSFFVREDGMGDCLYVVSIAGTNIVWTFRSL